MPFDIPPALREQVIEFVWSVPKGQVASYGQIASSLKVEDARVIGWIMHTTGNIPDFPWWRVVNNEGKISIKDPALAIRQKELLEAEDIVVGDHFTLDIEKYRYGGSLEKQQRLL